MTVNDDAALAGLLDHAADDIRPQDDLFGQINGKWLAEAEVPPDLPMVGGFMDLLLESEATVGDILRDAAADVDAGRSEPGSQRGKLGALFASFMDEGRVEDLGASPLADDLAAIAAVSDLRELAALLGRLGRRGVSGPFAVYVNTDDRQSDRYVTNVVQAGLGLPDESYYREESFAPMRDAYVAHVTAMFSLLGRSDDAAADAAARVMALETRLAADHWDKVRCRDVIAKYNLVTLDEARTLTPSFDWDAWLDAMADGKEVDLDDLLVQQPSYLEAMSTALVDVPLDDWRTWLEFHLVRSAAPYLSSSFVDTNFDFYGRTLTGAQELRERWKRAASLCGSAMGEAVGAEYVDRVYPPDAKAQMDELVANLIEAYRVSISSLDWMTDETKARALEKLGQFRPKVGHPVRWRDYSALEIDPADLYGNVARASAFETDRQLAKLGGPVDRDEWHMTPQTVNAYYNPGANEIVFPAAILRPPFFDPDADPALNYGGIGAVIGHEIGHGFDDQGSQYDGDGNLVDWWSDEDRAAFQSLADKLIAQYGDFEPRALPGQKVNGALTVGENIGDLGGLTIALLAYELSLDGEEAPIIDGLTGRERLFSNWSRIWRIKMRPERAQQLLAIDPHSPAEFRANIVRNLDEFHDTFGTEPGDELWLEPDDRVRIW